MLALLKEYAYPALLYVVSFLQSVFFRVTTSPKNVTLTQWQEANGNDEKYQNLWMSYRRSFQSRGYTLWKMSKPPGRHQVPPNDAPRAPDDFSRYNAYTAARTPTFTPFKSIHHAARAADNRDVLLVLLSDGTSGVNCIEALQKIATGAVASIDRNHTLPMLQQIQCGNLVFGAFPLVGSLFVCPYFRTVADALEAMSQIMEGVAFLHDRLVAHRDLFLSNFLPSRYQNGWERGRMHDFLRPRYYIIDFEWAVSFPATSDPATRIVMGPPTSWKNYRRAAPPEMKSGQAYCPFKADVWQLGSTFLECFAHLEEFVPEIIELLLQMNTDDPEIRPTARAAVNRLDTLRFMLSPDILQQLIEEPEWQFSDDDLEGEAQT